MALKCLACNHDNSAGDKFCGACGSSLDLRLCPGCEAVNRRGDTSCHSCGATLADEAIVPQRAQATAGAPGKRLGRWIKRAAIALPLAGIAVLAVHAYGKPGFAEEVAEAIRAAATRTMAMAAEVMKRDATGAQAAATPTAAPAAATVSAGLIKEPPPPAAVKMEVKQAPEAKVKQAPKVEVKQAPKAASAAPAQSTTAAPARLGRAPVTHTRAGVAAPAAPIVEAREKASAPARVPAPALEQPQPSPGGAGRPRVTHTRAAAAQPADAAPPRLVVETPAAAERPAAVEAGKDQSAPSGCTEEVIALGLCSTNAKGEGK